jgi:endonuclease YncB( thermonuclease family)
VKRDGARCCLLPVALALLLWPGLAVAEITGKPHIANADTLEIAGQIIHLHGVDAPGSSQTCRANGEDWPCGMAAENALAFFVAKSWVTCVERGLNNYGEVIAVCYAGGVGGPDLGRWLVQQGWAVADRSPDYATEEVAARGAESGIWRGRYTPTWRSTEPGEVPAPQLLLTLSGSPGVGFAGDCTLKTREGEQTLRLEGVVPAEQALAGYGLSCRVSKVGGDGELVIEISKGSGAISRSTIQGHSGTAIISVQ